MRKIHGKLLRGIVVIVLCLTTSAVTAAELQMAGIRLASSALSVLTKYGNPTEIRVGSSVQTETTFAMPSPTSVPGSTGAPAGLPGFPGQPGASEMTLPGYLTGALPPAPPSASAPPSTTGIPGMGAPSFTSPFQTTPTTVTPVVQQRSAPEVTWIYRFDKNKTLEFIISPDGRVVQIAAFGAEWPGVGTSKGVRLGQTYKDVVLRYGYPEQHERRGIELVLRYAERDRVVFTLVGKTLVGITIALMD